MSRSLLSFLLFLPSLLPAQSDFNVKAFDNLQVTILNVPQKEQNRINAVYQINQEGKIELWKIGDIKIIGRERKEIAEEIERRYREMEIYKDPQIQVIDCKLLQCNFRNITVGGQVNQSGVKVFQNNMTLSQALQLGGGIKNPKANIKIQIHRDGKIITLDATNKKHLRTKILNEDKIIVE